MKAYFNFLIYISILFSIFYLINNDYLIFPKIESPFFLSISFLLLFVAFIFQGLTWHQILKHDMPISIKHAISSVGLVVFAKYIPGKILIVAGRVEYIKKKYDYPRTKLISSAIYAQILVLWLGMLFGSLIIFSSDIFSSYIKYYILVILLFTFIIFTNIFWEGIKIIFESISGKEIKINSLSSKQIFWSLPTFLLYINIFSLAFYFFILSLTVDTVPLFLGFTFVLAFCLGIMAIIAPGGIGVREAVITMILLEYGLGIEVATTISLASRLWYFIGELFLFCVALFIDRIEN